MAEWVRTDLRFPDRVAWLTIGERTLCLLRGRGEAPDLFALMKRGQADPAEAELVLYDLIEEHRPDLAGGCLHAIHYQIAPQRWMFLYSHRSFPPVEVGGEYGEASLRPDLEGFPAGSGILVSGPQVPPPGQVRGDPQPPLPAVSPGLEFTARDIRGRTVEGRKLGRGRTGDRGNQP